MRWKPDRLLVRLLAPYLLTLAIVAAGLLAYGDWVLRSYSLEPTSAEVIDRMLAGMWIALVIAAAAMLLPVLLVSRRISERLTRLAEFSKAVAYAGMPASAVADAEDTVSRLEADLAAMATSLGEQLRSAREEKGKLEAVLRGMVEGVLVIDRDGTIRLSNQRADQLFGGTARSPLLGQPLINVSRDPELRDLVRAVMSGRGERHIRTVTLEGEGRETLQVTATPIPELNEPQLFILVFHDITELKRLEVTRRDFVANVSHELRTPLTAIRGYAETLRERAIEDPLLARKFVGIIERHSERLGRLIDDLLILSDLELGRTELQRAPMPLGPAVDAAIDVVREKAEQRQVVISKQLSENLPSLYADADRVEQVLVNLIDNAVKYTSPGGSVTVRAALASPSGPAQERIGGDVQQRPWIEIAVIDTGIGIPKHELPRLTERFYRVDKARSRELGGTGLGLAIVKHIVQAHQGALRIESEPGRGTCVRVYLPAAVTEAAAA